MSSIKAAEKNASTLNASNFQGIAWSPERSATGENELEVDTFVDTNAQEPVQMDHDPIQNIIECQQEVGPGPFKQS